MSTPDFDSMSPEELMAWMESLARRQGADEGFTSNVVMDVPEVDPSTVQDTGPGYIPYGMSQEVWEKKQADERERKARRVAAATPAPATAPTPVPVAPAAPPPAPIAVTPPPAPTPAAASNTASATPDFDSMSPEELMAWMESLARRQGADEGFTSNIVMDVAEIDPSTVQDTGPGYIPYGMSQELWEKKQADERERKARRAGVVPPAPQPVPSIPPAPTPMPEPVPPAPVPEPTPIPQEPPVPLPGQEPEAAFELSFFDNLIPEDTTQANLAADNPLAWLESLAPGGNQSASDLPQLDLSALGNPLGTPALQNEDPMAWLESLSGSNTIPGLEQFTLDTSTPAPTPPAVPSAPAQAATPSPMETGDNPLEWLESLAKRQGADEAEFMTGASLEVPLPEVAPRSQSPGYTDYSFETPEDTTSPLSFLNTIGEEDDFVAEYDDDGENPADWLAALATGQSAVPEIDMQKSPETAEIMDALSKNPVDPNAIESWMANLLEQGAQRNDVVEYDEEEEEAEEGIVEAQLPDWLLEQVGTPPPPGVKLPSTSPLVNKIVEPPAPGDMPAWLTEDISAPGGMDFDNIFDESIPAVSAPVSQISTDELVLDGDDPWVEAFEMERKQGLDDISRIPDWYTARLEGNDDDGNSLTVLEPETAETAFMAAITGTITGVSGGVDTALLPPNLPDEAELPAGELQSLPDWMADVATAAPAAVPAGSARVTAPVVVTEAAEQDMPDWLRDQVLEETGENELPDWLREAGIDDTSEVPDWLKETLSTDEAPAVSPAAASTPAVAPVPTPQPVIQPVVQPVAPPPAPKLVPAAASPAYITPAAASIDVKQVLESARAALQSNSVDTALQHYETIVRGNVALDAVVGDLNTLMKDETHKKNPAVHRILGDGLMRQGKLQEALDTYRKALNLL